MSFIDRLIKSIETFVDYNEYEEKGNEFEKYVADLFDPRYFSIVEWTSDISRKYDNYIESDSKPDLKIRYNPTNEYFNVECKFRSYLYEDKLHWSNWDQLNRYKDYFYKTKIPLFVVIGLSGYPYDPEFMFCIPIEEAKYPELYPSVLEKYERDPNKKFFWKNGNLI